MKPIGIILAGGQARRMGGGDKARLLLGGQSLLDRVCARLAPQVQTMALNANGDATRFADVSLPVVADSIPDFAGPLAGVLAGLDWAANQGEDAIVTVAADTPFFPDDLVAKLTQSTQNGLALAATPREDSDKLGLHPTFGLWPVALRDDLRQALADGTRKVLHWADRHGAGTAIWPDARAFFNVNTPEDLERAEDML